MFLFVWLYRELIRLLADLRAAATIAMTPVFRTLSGPLGVALPCTPVAMSGFSTVGRVPHGTRGRPGRAHIDVAYTISSRRLLAPFGANFCQPVWVTARVRGQSFRPDDSRSIELRLQSRG
jgi:hypothetical protein